MNLLSTKQDHSWAKQPVFSLYMYRAYTIRYLTQGSRGVVGPMKGSHIGVFPCICLLVCHDVFFQMKIHPRGVSSSASGCNLNRDALE